MMTGWQPISTAPKDGTRILLAEPNPGGTDIEWLVIEARWVDCPQAKIGRFAVRDDWSDMWVAAYPAIYTSHDPDERDWICKPIVALDPTHWMPLPTPPSRQEDA